MKWKALHQLSKKLELSEGLFSHRVGKGYPVRALVWTDKTIMSKYGCEVSLCTKAVNLDPMPMLVDSGKQAWVWIYKKPKAAKYDHLVFPGVCLDHTTEA